MSARSDELSNTLLADSNSNHDLTAQTAQGTVMAEQVSHNVVDNSESMGESPVDVAANQTNTTSAEYGTTTTEYFDNTISSTLEASQAANEHAVQTISLSASMQPEAQVLSEAEPSAGDAEGLFNEADIVLDSTALEDSNAEYAQLVNGIHDVATPGEDEGMREGSVDVSLNSDTEGSRGDASEMKKDDKHHVRSNSVKKPTTFSKVSVTKNFLAKSATATPPLVKAGEKPSPAGTPVQPSALRPRLIAKTGTAIAQKTRLGSEPTGGPDASKVWNKNRREYLQTTIYVWEANPSSSRCSTAAEAIHR